MPEFKYVIVCAGTLGVPTAILFPREGSLQHSDVVQAFGALPIDQQEYIGAGFCRYSPIAEKFDVWGKSMSLGGMEAKEQDARIINRQLLGIKE